MIPDEEEEEVEEEDEEEAEKEEKKARTEARAAWSVLRTAKSDARCRNRLKFVPEMWVFVLDLGGGGAFGTCMRLGVLSRERVGRRGAEGAKERDLMEAVQMLTELKVR